MICIGGDLHRRPPMHALYALSQDAPAGRGCTEEMCYRSRTRPQDGGRRVPTRGKNGLQRRAKRTGKTPCDDPRAPPRGVHPGARGRRRRNREPKVSHVSLWVAPGRAGGHPRPRSPSAVGHGPWPIAIRHVEPGSLGMWSPSPGTCHLGGDL